VIQNEEYRRRAMGVKIVTLTGVSGSGKSTIAGNLLMGEESEFQFVLSTTTRKVRPSDLVSEYEYVEEEQFLRDKADGKFLWTAEFGGYYYGTKGESILDVLQTHKIGILILVPEAVHALKKFFKRLSPTGVMSFYIGRGLPKEILRVRMRERGDSEEQIDRMIAQCSHWPLLVEKLGCIDYYLCNATEPIQGELASNEIRRLVSL
jgi:guanylate kinase